MPDGTEVGSSYVTIYPTLDPGGLKDSLTAAARDAGSEGGDEAGEAFKAALDASTEDAKPKLGDTAEEGAKAGVEAGEGFRAGLDASTDGAGGGIGDDLAKELGDAGDDAGKSFKDKFDKSSGGDNGDGPFGSLLTAALALGPALVTASAETAGALIGISLAAGDAAVGLGAFALAAKPLLAGVEAQAEAMIAVFQQSNEQYVFPALEGGLALLPPLLTSLTPAVRATAASLEGLETSAKGALDGQFYQQFFQILSGQGGQTLTAFGHFLGGLGTAAAGLDEAFAPLIDDVDRDLTKIGADLDAFGQRASGSTGIASFISYLQTNGPLLVHTLENVGSAIIGLGRDAAPLGPIELQIVDAGAKLLADLEQLSPGLVELGVAALSVYKATKLLPFSVGAAATAVKGLFSSTKEGEAATEDASADTKKAAVSFGLLGTAGIVAAAALGTVAVVLASSNNAVAAIDKSAASAGKTFTEDFINSLSSGTDKIAAVRAEIDLLQNDLANNKTKAGGLALINEIIDLKSALPGLTAQQKAQNDALAASAAVTAQTLTPTESLVDDLNKMATAADQVTTDLDDANAALGILTGNAVSADQANTAFYQALDSLSSSLKTNKDDFNDATAAGQANHQALDSLVGAIQSNIEAQEKQGDSVAAVSASLTSQVAQLDAVAAHGGLTTKQIEALNAEYGLTPKDIATDIEIYGASGAAAQVASVKQQLDSLPTSKTIDINLSTNLATRTLASHLPAGAGYAAGTSGATAGPHWVGENGPELMDFRGGETVIPHDQSMMLARPPTGYADGVGDLGGVLGAVGASRGPAVVIEQATFNEPVDVDMLLNRASFALASSSSFGAAA